jgi:hypothetical protein
MEEIIPRTVLWWLVTVDMPIAAGVLVMISRMRREFEQTLQQINTAIHDHKLEVARAYAPLNHVRDLEQRLVAHLLRIESKLDNTALKTQTVLAAQHNLNFKGE